MNSSGKTSANSTAAAPRWRGRDDGTAVAWAVTAVRPEQGRPATAPETPPQPGGTSPQRHGNQADGSQQCSANQQHFNGAPSAQQNTQTGDQLDVTGTEAAARVAWQQQQRRQQAGQALQWRGAERPLAGPDQQARSRQQQRQQEQVGDTP
jgi:hypothetical protein